MSDSAITIYHRNKIPRFKPKRCENKSICKQRAFRVHGAPLTSYQTDIGVTSDDLEQHQTPKIDPPNASFGLGSAQAKAARHAWVISTPNRLFHFSTHALPELSNFLYKKNEKN